MIIEKQKKEERIFLTDGKRFILNISLKSENIYQNQKRKIYEKVTLQIPKFSLGIIVTDGISYRGIGKLIYIIRTMGVLIFAGDLNV